MKAYGKYDKYVEYWRDLEMWIRWSFNVTEKCQSTCTIFKLTWNNIVTLKSRLEVT